MNKQLFIFYFKTMKKQLNIVLVLFILIPALNFSQTNSDSLTLEKPWPKNMTVSEFKLATSKNDQLVWVNFSADWCVVCKKQKPILNEMKAEKGTSIVLIELDMKDNPLIAAYFEVDGLPVNLLFKNGTMVWDRMGLLGKKEMLNILRIFESK